MSLALETAARKMAVKTESFSDFEEARITGVKVNYYFVCKRKLWLFSKGLAFESSSEKVALGKLLHEIVYPSAKKREVLINNLIRIDAVSRKTVRETKYSSKMLEADRWQVYYYLFYLEQLGIKREGEIAYPKEKRVERIRLTDEIREKLIEVLKDIERIVSLPKPPEAEKHSYCRACAYYDFCFSED